MQTAQVVPGGRVYLPRRCACAKEPSRRTPGARRAGSEHATGGLGQYTGLYIVERMCAVRSRGRGTRASPCAYATSATETAISAETSRMSRSGG
jgi:hypothetical protein